MLGLPDGVTGMPVRPRRGPDPDREGPRRGLEGDVRRVPARARRRRLRAVHRRATTTRYVDGKPRYDGVRSFLQSRGIDDDEGLVRELGDRKNDARAQEDPRRRRRGLRGLASLPARRRATPGCAARSCSSSANAEDVLEVTGLSRAGRGAGRRRRRRGARPAGQAGARHVPRGRAAARRRARPGGGVRGRAGRRRRRGAPATSARSSGSTASARPTRCASTAPTSS